MFIYQEEGKEVVRLMKYQNCKLRIASGFPQGGVPRKLPAVVCLLLVGFLCLSTVGCAQISNFTTSIGNKLSGRSAGFEVIPLSNQEVVALDADDVVQVMRRAGFSDEQILRLGTDLRNALLYSGAVQIKLRDKVEAVFAVHGDYVFITTRLRGSFIYDVNRGWVKLGAVPQQGS